MAASVAVTRRNVSEMPLVGAGFGGHPARFAEIAGNRLDALGVGRLNAEDAGSLLLRSVSETGLLGLSLLLLSIVIPTVLACLQVRAIAKWRQAGGNSDLLPLLSALIGGMSSVFVVYLIRNGHYFDLNFWLPFAIMLTVGFCRPLALNHCFAQQPRLRRWRVKLI
jgi:O-antigen ligase